MRMPRRRSTSSSTVLRSRRRSMTQPRRPRRPSTWIVVLARTLRTGKSDSRAAVAAQQHDHRRGAVRAAIAIERRSRRTSRCRSCARRRPAHAGTAPARCPRRRRFRRSRPSPPPGRSVRTARRAGPRPTAAPSAGPGALPLRERKLERPADHQRDEALLRLDPPRRTCPARRRHAGR